MYEYKAIITKVIDGDTFDFSIDMGFGLYYTNRLRLFGCDTPEIRGKEREDGLKVKKYVHELLFNKEVILRTHKWKGKYGRYIANVFFHQDKSSFTWTNLSEHLIEKGMAEKVNYD